MKKDDIAPFGMNCILCLAYQRDKKRCLGCNSDDINKPEYCKKCIIKNCENIINSKSQLCFECEKMPCKRLKQLDLRYRTKYDMSMIDNLNFIKFNGMKKFIEKENKRWTCNDCGNLLCVHRKICLHCKK